MCACLICELKKALNDAARMDVLQRFVEALIKSNGEQTSVSEIELAAMFARHFQRKVSKFVSDSGKANELAELAGLLERLYEVPEESREFTEKAFGDLN